MELSLPHLGYRTRLACLSLGTNLTVRWWYTCTTNSTQNDLSVGEAGDWKGKLSDKDWLSPTVKGGYRYIYKGVSGCRPNNLGILLQVQNWNQRCLLISSFPFSCMTETKKVLCCCATHFCLFSEMNMHGEL